MIRITNESSGKEVCAFAFETRLGWVAILGVDGALVRLTFGQHSAGEALRALRDDRVAEARLGNWHPTLVRRLRTLASGRGADFSDIHVDLGPRTRFQQRVLDACRQIPCGQTSTYAQLAAAAGSPAAARAVGTVMATNPVPLVVPCHRVLASGGGWGGYSGGEGIATKRWLLAAEARLEGRGSDTSRSRGGKRVVSG